MQLNFQKMHANGDDFVIVDSRHSANPVTSAMAQRMGDRNRGVGFNQLAVLLDCDDADARVMFWNADGSALDVCGSATRGAADRLMREANVTSVKLRTNRGLLTCERTPTGDICVEMGVPLFGWSDVPLAQELDTAALPLVGSPAACSMGNPHCTFFVDDLASIDIATIGPAIETNPLFPLKTNVHFVQIIDRKHIRLRIWERGAGIALGSGSCSCGAVVNGVRRGLLDNTVEVECDGGCVTVHWNGVDKVFLIGPVQASFSGTMSQG
ncbi:MULTISPECIES: diaminopimelate epimerase [Pseudomonas]|uniref:Diaminopimelate epimerase n=1 Tax=Pseudomonas fluorescens (strain Q2-87) TaxID=1038922 RepID=J2EKX6_PSEFQ|nr:MULTISPECIES: diaminopimelate epimerase [Pseudomonas]EJL04195.1 diaminopimelate epimerase [Pseudomonas fluorescens Q2-87]